MTDFRRFRLEGEISAKRSCSDGSLNLQGKQTVTVKLRQDWREKKDITMKINGGLYTDSGNPIYLYRRSCR